MQSAGGSPRHVPSRSLFIVGAWGHFLAGVLAIPFSIFTLGSLSPFATWSTVPFAMGIGMCVALLIHQVGFLGLWKILNSQVAGAVFGFGVAAAVLLLASLILSPQSWLAVAGVVVVGAGFILEGAAYIANRHVLLQPSCSAAAVLFIVAGAFLASFFLGVNGGIMAVPAMFLGGIVLLKAPVPVAVGPTAP